MIDHLSLRFSLFRKAYLAAGLSLLFISTHITRCPVQFAFWTFFPHLSPSTHEQSLARAVPDPQFTGGELHQSSISQSQSSNDSFFQLRSKNCTLLRLVFTILLSSFLLRAFTNLGRKRCYLIHPSLSRGSLPSDIHFL